VDPKDCPRCGGTGYVAKPVDSSSGSEGIAFIRLKCPACAGSGRKNSIPPTTAGWPHGLWCLRKRTSPALSSFPPWRDGPGSTFYPGQILL